MRYRFTALNLAIGLLYSLHNPNFMAQLLPRNVVWEIIEQASDVLFDGWHCKFS